MLYTLITVISLHWGAVPTTSHVITHEAIPLEQCQQEGQAMVTWQNQLKQKMAGKGDVAVYPACVPNGAGSFWWAVLK